jgi:cytochrome P450
LSTPSFIADMVRVTTYAEVDEILRNPEFASGGFEHESAPFRADTLLELNGDAHRARRKVEIPLFARAMLDRLEGSVLDPVIEHALREADAGRRPDGVVATDLARLSHRIFLQVAAGVIGLDDATSPARTDLLEACMYRLNAGFDVKFSTRDHDEVVAEGLEAKRQFVEHFVGPSLERRAALVERHRRGQLEREELPSDLLTMLLRHDVGRPDPDIVVRESILFMAGATDTTSNAVNHAIADLEAWLAEHPEDRARSEDVAFLRGVCNESLRLHPNVTALARRATRDIALASGRLVRAGTEVALDLVAASRDEAVFGPDADRFDPWRPAPAGAPPYGVAFGTGRHVCIGRPLVTPVSGRPTGKDEGERALLRVVRALVRAGVRLDPEAPPQLAPTAEDVYASLPVLLTRR